MNWLAFLVGLGAVVGTFLIAEAVRGLFRWLGEKGIEVEQGVVDALLVGVQGAWDELVRDLKEKAADGRLTPEERRQARAKAKEIALHAARGPVANALRAMAPEAVDALVSLLVQRRKEERARGAARPERRRGA